MSELWQEKLAEAWGLLRQYQSGARQFRTRRLSDKLELSIFAGIRSVDNAPCILIDSEVSQESLFEVGGMRLSVASGDRGPLLVLSLEDNTKSDLFTTLCADAILASEAGDRGSELSRFLSRLDAWRRFLRDRNLGLSRNETVGLLGELVVLEALVSRCPTMSIGWEAPDNGLHDFYLGGHSLEVKTSLRASSQIYISSIAQMENEGLDRLDLIHVRLFESAQGRSVAELISDVSANLPNEGDKRAFQNALLRRGLMPDDTIALSRPRVQVSSIDAYCVEEDFPRIVRSATSTAIIDAEYTLDLQSVTRFATASDSVFDEFCKGYTK